MEGRERSGGEVGTARAWTRMSSPRLSGRLARLPSATVVGHEVRLARGFRPRLLGLSGLDRDEVGAGLLIPRCASVHTFGMRFPLDLYFLDRGGAVIEMRPALPPRRLAFCAGASAILEIPAGMGGEFSPRST